MRFIRYSSLLVLLLAVLLAGSWFWLLHTAAGARFLWQQAGSATGGALAAEEISGSLGAGLTLDGVRYRDGTVGVSAASLALAVDVDLIPLSVEISDAAIASLAVEIAAGDAKPDAAPADLQQLFSALQLPLWLHVDELAIRDATVLLPGMGEAQVIDRLVIRADWRDTVFVDRLEASFPGGSATATGTLELFGSNRVNADLGLTLREPVLAADERVAIAASVAGSLQRFSFETTGDLTLADFESVAVTAGGRGSLSDIAIERFWISGEDLRANGKGAVAFGDTFAFTANVDIAHANPAVVTGTWPAGHPVRGALSVEYRPGQLVLEDTELTIVGTEGRVSAEATIDTATGRVAAMLDWQALSWPVASPEPQVASGSGGIEVGGTVDDWTAVGTINVAVRDLDEARITLEGEGGREGMSAKIEQAQLIGGSLEGFASISWTGARAWAADVDVTGIDVGALLPDWPGRLSGHVAAEGRIEDAWLRATVENLRGRLRDEAFAADGGVEIADGEFIAHGLSLEHGTGAFRLDGAHRSPGGLAFDVNLTDIGDYVGDATGALQANGRLSMYEPSPFLRVDATAELLRFGDFHISGLHIRDRAERGDALELDISAEDVSFAGERILAPSLTLDATSAQQTATLTGRYNDFGFAIGLEGALDSWQSPRQWNGQIASLRVNGGDAEAITLVDPVPVVLSAERVSIERMCLTEASDTSLCVDLDWRVGTRIDLAADVAGMPVNLVNRFRDTGFVFDQALTGRIRWQQVQGERANGAGEIQFSPGTIVNLDRPELEIQTDTGSAAFEIQNGRLLRGTLGLPMPGTGNIDGRFAVLDVTSVASSDIEGRLEFGMQDIGVFAVLTPMLDGLGGEMNGSVTIGGSVDAPVVNGDMRLANGSINYLPIGLRLRELNLDASLEPGGHVVLDGSFIAGEGRAEITTPEAHADSTAPGLRLNVRGERLTVIDVPDVRALADAALDIGFDGGTLTLGGEIRVPYARIQPENLPASRTTVSEDVVIVEGRLPEQASAEAESAIDIRGSLVVAIGPDVVIDLDVAKAAVNGSATFSWQGDAVPLADGRYTLSGDIQTFGQVLKIVEGGVRFPNVPADNPVLRIRAEREIYGNVQVRSAGVLVDGTLARPTIEPYTYPPTNKERALTLLVTGSDFNLEQGVGSVDFGTYVAPKLFVSYGVGLFGRDNVISARYDLAKGFGVKATSGQQESGVDFIYRFER